MNHDFVYLFSDLGSDASRAGERPLVLTEAPEELRKQGDAAEAEIARRLDSARLPVGLRILRSLSWLLAFAMLMGVLRAEVSLARAYANAPGVFWIGGAALLIALILELIRALKSRRVLRDPSFQEYSRLLERANEEIQLALNLPEEIRSALDLPEDGNSLEILELPGKPGKPSSAFSAPARNREVDCCQRQGELCLFDGSRVLALPLAGAKLRLLEWGVPVDGSTWLRKDRPDSRKYRQYGVLCGNGGQIGLSFCCALEVWKDGRGYRLLFPAYELERVSRLTGLNTPALPQKSKRGTFSPETEAKTPVRPAFYWRFPRERAGFWATPHADVGFRAAHPKLYVLLVCLGLFVLLLPLLLQIFLIPAGMPANGWVILLGIGCLTVGTGLFNIVAAWMHQYLGHWFTLGCLLVGGLMMALGWMLML